MTVTGKSQVDLIGEVDPTTRARIASLCARGLSDASVADLLFLTVDHIVAVKTTDEYRTKFSSEADRIIQEQIDRDEGWDGIETAAITTLLQTLKFNRDPKFTLQAAMVANRAERRAKSKKNDPAVIDATAQQPGAKIIVLNRTYIDNRSINGAIDVGSRPKEIPLKQSDMPSPKLVDQFLAPAKEKAGIGQRQSDTELDRMFREAGVVFDKDEHNGS